MNDPFASAPQRQDLGQDIESGRPTDIGNPVAATDSGDEPEAVDQSESAQSGATSESAQSESAMSESAQSESAQSEGAQSDAPLPDPAGSESDDVAPIVDEVIDLDAIERDLTDVQTALERLNEGSYWTDEVTGEALPDEVVASFPLTRTVAGRSTT